MAIFIAIIIFIGVVSYVISTSSTSGKVRRDEESELEDMYLIDEDIFDEERDGFI